MEIRTFTCLVILGGVLTTLISILAIIKLFKDAKKLGQRFSYFWLAVVVFIPVLGPLYYLIAKRD